MLLHPTRYHIASQTTKLGVVVHDSESGDGSSANLVSILQQPGTIPSGDHFYGAGYHAVTDGKGSYVSVADATAAPNSAPPLNDTYWHVCMPGFANQTRDQWLDQLSLAHIRGVALFIANAWLRDGCTWEPAYQLAADMLAGHHGWTAHYQVSLAWHKTTHYDPGPFFPFDVLQAEVNKLIHQEDEMQTSRLIRFKGYINVFLVGGGGPAMAVGGADFEYLVGIGTPKIFLDHHQEMISVCAQAGINPADPGQLVPGGSDTQF